jgi:hypothetical protein
VSPGFGRASGGSRLDGREPALTEVEGRLSVRGVFLVPAVDGLHLGDASVGPKTTVKETCIGVRLM